MQKKQYFETSMRKYWNRFIFFIKNNLFNLLSFEKLNEASTCECIYVISILFTFVIYYDWCSVQTYFYDTSHYVGKFELNRDFSGLNIILSVTVVWNCIENSSIIFDTEYTN